MTPEEQKAILAIALFAAFADGSKADSEREEIRRIAQSLAADSGAADLTRLYQDVLLRRVRLDDMVVLLSDPGQRQLAYEMAVCVCDADGRQSAAEGQFLAELKRQLHPDPRQAAEFESQADAIVTLSEAALPAAAPAPARPATATKQFGRKLLGGLLGKAAGKTIGRLGGAATGMAFSFATTYALGQAAKRYYAGGRVMSTELLRETFQGLLAPARQMQTQYLPQIRQKAASLDAGQVMALVRGG